MARQVLAMPILTEEGELIGCVEAVNKVAERQHETEMQPEKET